MSRRVCVLLTGLIGVALVAPAVTAQGVGEPPLPGTQRLWVEELDTTRTPQAYVEANVSSQFILPATILWDGRIVAAEPFDHITARVVVADSDDNAQYAGEVLQNVVVGPNAFSIAWTPESLPDGTYSAKLSVVRADDMELASRTYRVRQISGSRLETSIRDLAEELQRLETHLQTADFDLSPYFAARLAIAHDYAPVAAQAYTDGSWRRAMDDAVFLRALLESIRANLSLSTGMDSPAVSPMPDVLNVSVSDGQFESGGRTAFLFGAVGGSDELASEIPALRRYGLNLLDTRIGPADTLLSQGDAGRIPQSLDTLLSAADTAGMGVTISLAPDALPSWAYDAWPALAERRAGTFPYDLTHPDVDEILARHIHTLVPAVAQHPCLVSLILADRPEMQFTGEAIRRGLISFAKHQYGDRETMNRAWGTFYLDYDEIVLDWNSTRPAYLHDLSLYQYELGTAFLAHLAETARKDAPKTLLQVNQSDRAFDSGESAFGLNRDAIAAFTDISGCSAVESLDHPYLELGFPTQSLNYTLLRSLDHAAPVYNSWDTFIAPDTMPANALGAAAYALAWEGAIAGMNASAAPLGKRDGSAQTLLGRPQRLEGYARACLDLNRLAPIVTAFQQAPPEVGILWSLSSKIYNDGEPYLESVKHAYEGCHTFGFKVAFITEEDCQNGALDSVRILVLPEAPSMTDEAFAAIDSYIARGGITIRQGKPIPYNPSGLARQDTLTTSSRTILIRGIDWPTEYLHALDAVCEMDGAPSVPRPVNASHYPLEGVKSRYTMIDDAAYLYVINLRKEPVHVGLTGPYSGGTDLISGNPVQFPVSMDPVVPLLVRLDQPLQVASDLTTEPTSDRPLGIVEPIQRQTPETTPERPVTHQEMKR